MKIYQFWHNQESSEIRKCLKFQQLTDFFFIFSELRDNALRNSDFGKQMRELQAEEGFWKRTYRLSIVRITEQHSVLGIFGHPEGTNFSTAERVACFHIYLIAVMACSALFYGQEKPTVCDSHS